MERGNKLVILDFNGVFVDKVFDPLIETGQTGRTDKGIEYKTIKNFIIYFRPNYREILDEIAKRYSVAFWSSTTEQTAQTILSLMGLKKYDFRFIWFRENTLFDPNYGIDEGIERHDTVKNLTNVYLNPVGNKDRKWDEKNTLIIEDSPKKVKYNPIRNVLILDPFDHLNPDSFDFPENLLEIISNKFEEMEK